MSARLTALLFVVTLLAPQLARAQEHQAATLFESDSISAYPAGFSYQIGPGDTNPQNWTYRYGVKLTINGGVYRNWELSSMGKDAEGLVFRQYQETAKA